MANTVYTGSDVSIKMNFGNYEYRDFVYLELSYFTSPAPEATRINCKYVQATSELTNMNIAGGMLYALLPADQTELLTPGKLRCIIKYGLTDQLFPDQIKDVVEEIPTNVEIKTVV